MAVASLAALEVLVSLNSQPLKRGMGQIGGYLKGQLAKLQSLIPSGGIAGMLGLGAGLGTGAALTGMLRAAGNFHSAMAESLAVAGDVSDDMRRKMEEAALSIAETTTFSAAEAARGYFFLASAGLTAEQQLAALPVAAKFAQAGNFGLEQATSMLADTMSAMGLSSDDAAQHLANMRRVSDVVAKANILANASTQEFAEALQNRAAAAGRSAGKSIEEVTAVLAAMAGQGIKGARAGMELSMFMRDLTDAAMKNSAAWKLMGIQVFDSSGNMRNMADVVADLERTMGGLSDARKAKAFEKLGITASAQGVAMQLMGTSDAIRKFQAGLEDAGGATDELAANQLKAFNAQVKLLWNTLENLAIGVGTQVLPALQTMIGWAKGFIEALKPFTAQIATVVKWFAGLAAAGALLIALPTVFGALSALVSVLVSPLGLVLGALVAIGAAVHSVFADETLGAPLIATLQEIWALLQEISGNVLTGLLAAWNQFAGTVSSFWGEAKAKGAATFQSILNWVKQVAEWAAIFTTDWALAWEYIKTMAQLKWMEIVDVVKGVWTEMQAIAGGMAAGFVAAFKGLYDYLKATFTEIQNLFEALWAGMKAGWEAGLDGAAEAFKKKFIETLAAQQNAAVPNIAASVVGASAGAYGRVKAAAQDQERQGRKDRLRKDLASMWARMKQEREAKLKAAEQAPQPAGPAAAADAPAGKQAPPARGSGGVPMGGQISFSGITEFGKQIQEALGKAKTEKMDRDNHHNLKRIADGQDQLASKLGGGNPSKFS